MDVKFFIGVSMMFLLVKNSDFKTANITEKCFTNVKNLYDQILDTIKLNEQNNLTLSSVDYKKFVVKLEKLQNDTDKLNTLAVFEKLESIKKKYKADVNSLEKQRLVLHSKLISNEENMNVLEALFIEAQEKLLNATELENIINIHDKEIKIISKEAQHILDEVENLVVLIIGINETYDATKLITKNVHDNKTEINNLIMNITDTYLKLQQKINATNIKNNETLSELIKLDDEIDGLQISELPKIDKCNNFEAELVDLVNKQSNFFNDIEKTANNVTQLQKSIKETYNNLNAYEKRADLAVEEINETLSLVAEFKNGFNKVTLNMTSEIEKKLSEILALIDEVIEKAENANETLTIALNDANSLINETTNFDALVENVTSEFLNLSNELDELNINFYELDFSPNEAKLNETKLSIADLEENYKDVNSTFQNFLKDYDDLYRKRKNELKDIKSTLSENEKSLQILKEYVTILDHIDFSDEKLDDLEEEIENAEEIMALFEEKDRLEREVEIVKGIYEGLPKSGKKYCMNIEIEPISET